MKQTSSISSFYSIPLNYSFSQTGNFYPCLQELQKESFACGLQHSCFEKVWCSCSCNKDVVFLQRNAGRRRLYKKNHYCFHVDFPKFLRAAILYNTCEWLFIGLTHGSYPLHGSPFHLMFLSIHATSLSLKFIKPKRLMILVIKNFLNNFLRKLLKSCFSSLFQVF